MEPIEVIVPDRKDAIEFVQIIMGLNHITDYVLVKQFSKPGVVFIDEQKASLKDLIYGCQIFRLDLGMYLRLSTVKAAIENLKIGIKAPTYSVGLDGLYAARDTLLETQKTIESDIREAYRVEKFGKSSHPMDILYEEYWFRPDLEFMRRIVMEVLDGQIRKEDLTCLQLESYPAAFDADQVRTIDRYLTALQNLTEEDWPLEPIDD